MSNRSIATLSLVLVAACATSPRVDFSVSPNDVSETGSVELTCTGTPGSGDAEDKVKFVHIFRVGGSAGGGVLAPAPAGAVPPGAGMATTMTFTPVVNGNSGEENFMCQVGDVGGDANTKPVTLVVREASKPTVNVLRIAPPIQAGAVKIGNSFTVTVEAIDNPEPLRSGIDTINAVKVGAAVTVTPTEHDAAGVPKGPPTHSAGPEREEATFTVTCVAEGDAKVSFLAYDAAGNVARSADIPDFGCVP